MVRLDAGMGARVAARCERDVRCASVCCDGTSLRDLSDCGMRVVRCEPACGFLVMSFRLSSIFEDPSG